MQRDAYAALIGFPKTRKVPLRIMQLNGAVFYENVMPAAFIGYQRRRLALMTYSQGQDPRLPRLPHDIIVPTFQALLKIHQPHFMYQLLPLLSADVEAFAAMQAICSSPGSPFTIRDRVEVSVLNYRFTNLCAGRDQICEFFKDDTMPAELLMPTATRRLPVPGVAFQGVLFCERMPLRNAVSPSLSSASSSSGSGAVLITTHENCTESIIHQRALMTRFFRSPLYRELSSNVPLVHMIQSSTYQWHALAIRRRISNGRMGGGDQRMRSHLVQLAAKDNLLLYEKVDDGVYEYVH